MNPRKSIRRNTSLLWIVCGALALLLSACQQTNVATTLPPVQPTQQETVTETQPVMDTQVVTDTQVVSDTQAPVQETAPIVLTGDLSLELMGIATGQTIEYIAAVPASADQPFWEATPEHHLLSLQGYPVSDHLLRPQIFVFPVAGLAQYNEHAGQIAADLQALLQSQQPGEHMPFLPLYNAAQVMHSQVQFLDFKNGSGVRYLTQYDQAYLPINSYELIYTFQGLTSDGQFYIAAVLPISHPDLPATDQIGAEQADELLSDFATYLTETVSWLDQQPAGAFTPDLSALDAMIQSIEVK
jgi:hypothetical protein